MSRSQSVQSVWINCTNRRGERSLREIVPERLWFGESERHGGRQWLLDAHDVAEDAPRTFAMRNIERRCEVEPTRVEVTDDDGSAD